MRLGFITSLIPTQKPDTGFEIANAAIVEALRAAGHEVVVIGFARPTDELPDDPDRLLLGRIVIENHEAPPLRKAMWLAAALAYGLPVTCTKLRLQGTAKVEEAVRAAGPFDALVLNSVTMAGAFPGLGDIAPCVLVEHNIEHVSAAQNAGHASGPMRLLFGREARLLRLLEQDLWRRSRFIWCLAEEDRRALGPAHQAKSATLPLVPPASVTSAPAGGAPQYDVGLIGTWTWEPNLIGLRWFLGEVAPLLPSGLSVAVAGRLPEGLAVPENVTLLGRVPDAVDFLGECRVVALASRAGTGVQLKTIETLSLGLPAVATPLSMRGLSGHPENIVLADEPADFARALTKQVDRVRNGQIGLSDGASFLRRQRNALAGALDEGLNALRADRVPARVP